MNSNWIELHEKGEGIIINTNKIIAIKECDNQNSYVYLSRGNETVVDESYKDILTKLGMNQLKKQM